VNGRVTFGLLRESISKLVFAVGLAIACTQKGPPPEPFSYSDAIANLPTSSRTDRSLEFARCVDLWAPWAAADRGRVAELVAGLRRDHRTVVLLELGHPSWGVYEYVVVADGRVERALPSSPGTQPGTPVLSKLHPGTLRTEVVEGVDDGTCWFLTIEERGRRRHVLAYGPLDEMGTSSTAGVLNALAPHLRRP
jgi:hypothetical protein